MEQLLQSLRVSYPGLHFVVGKSFYWSPISREVFYAADDGKPSALWSLLHETSHALLGHINYSLDFELLELEVAAWQRAEELAKQYSIIIKKSHIEDCLDSYRDWLHRRSVCPTCETQALQQDRTTYHCFNCQTSWHVTPSRFCRPYRQNKSQAKSPVVFATTGDSLKLASN